MKYSARLQLQTCLVLYATCAHAIMVKFGTKDGPIEPDTPAPELPAPQPYRAPAPVWEERIQDTPDPNAQWRPQLFIPQPRYTNVAYNGAAGAPIPPREINSVQQFINSYIPKQLQQPQYQPIPAKPFKTYFAPSQVLSSQALPGFGIRYFVPAYVNDLQERKKQIKQEDAKHNQIETNDVAGSRDSSSDVLWKYEKDVGRRLLRNTQEETAKQHHQWSPYTPVRHQ